MITTFLQQARELAARGRLHLWHPGLLQGGDDQDGRPRAMAQAADLLLVMVSPSLDPSEDPAWPVLEQRLRRRELRVLPILLRPRAFDDELWGGLAPLPRSGVAVQRWKDKDQAWATVLRELADALAASPPPPEALRGSVLQSIGVLLDRKPHWDAFTAHCRAHPCTLTLLTGPPHHGLPFFVDRIRHHLPEHEALLRVELNDHWERQPAASADQWENALRASLIDRLRVSAGTLPGLLADAARDQGLLLLLARKPLERHHLKPERRPGLHALVTRLVPAALRAAAPRHPVRVVLPLHHQAGAPGPGSDDELLRWGRACLQPEAPLAAQELAVAGLPTLDEVLASLRERRPLDAEDQAQIAAFYHELLQSPRPSFGALVDELERYV